MILFVVCLLHIYRELERRGLVKRALSVHPGTVQTNIVVLDGWLSKAQQALSPYFLRPPNIAANAVLTAAISKPDVEDIVSKTEAINHKYPADKWLHYANGQGVVCPRSCLKFKSHERNDAIAKALWEVSEQTLENLLAKPPPKKKKKIIKPPPPPPPPPPVPEPVVLEEEEAVKEDEVLVEEVVEEVEEEEIVEKEEEEFTINEDGEVVFREEL